MWVCSNIEMLMGLLNEAEGEDESAAQQSYDDGAMYAPLPPMLWDGMSSMCEYLCACACWALLGSEGLWSDGPWFWLRVRPRA